MKNSPRGSRSKSGICRQDFWRRHKRNRQILQAAGWNTRPGGGHCRRPKISEPHRRSGGRRCLPRSCNRHRMRTWLVVRSNSRSRGNWAPGVEEYSAGIWTRGLPVLHLNVDQELGFALFPSRSVATISLGVLGVMGAMLSGHRHFLEWLAYSVSKATKGIGNSYCHWRANTKEVLQASVGTGASSCLLWVPPAGLVLGILATPGCWLRSCIRATPPRSAGISWCSSRYGVCWGLAWPTWIPAQRALSVDPLILLRRGVNCFASEGLLLDPATGRFSIGGRLPTCPTMCGR